MKWLYPGLVLLAACWQRPAPPAPDRTIRIGITTESWKLDNGLRVVLVRDPRATQVTVTVQYAIGSSADPRGHEGLAHVVEHVLFEPLLDGASLTRHLDAAALAYNAFTEADATTYTARAWPQQLETLLAIEAARLDQHCASVSDDAFGRAHEIVRNEARERSASWKVAAEIDHAVFPPGHPYDRPPATLRTLDAITRDEACAFADAHYGTNNAVVVVSGPIDRTRVDAALAPLARLRHDVATPEVVVPPPARKVVRAVIPITTPAVLVAWPLAGDPVLRDQQRAVIGMLAQLVSAQVNASTSLREIGGLRGRMLAIALFPAAGSTIDEAVAGVERARFRLQDWFGSGLFEASRERAVFHILASLDESVERSRAMAEDAFAGRDVQQTAEARIASVHALSRARAEELAETFTVERATIVTIIPDDISGAMTSSIAPAIHEMPRTVTADPAAAQTPAPRPDARLPEVITRTLPTGLTVVLIPSSSVRTFDARLVIPAGTAAEPPSQRGVALLAAAALAPNPGDGSQMLRFYVGGGAFDAQVHADATVFTVHGVDGQLDQQLSALGRLIENGGYGDFSDDVRDLALETHLEPDAMMATLVWRRALYGEGHPYVDSGLWQRAGKFSAGQVSDFRDQHYAPAGATLVITGGFDADLAARWADYAFADWRGTASPVVRSPAHFRPFAFAQTRPTSQIAFRAALPVAIQDRAAALVTAEMLATALSDVREQLAASYGVTAALGESRAGAAIEIAGEVDATRAEAAFALIRERIAQLRAPTPDTAARFVEARSRVLDRLFSMPAAAEAVADRVQAAIELGRPAGDDEATAELVRTLTLDRTQPVLGKLDLSAAAMLLSGPDAAVAAAYKALGRQPVVLKY